MKSFMEFMFFFVIGLIIVFFQRGVAEGVQNELEELRRKNRLLTEELSRKSHQAERPYETQAKEEAAPAKVIKFQIL